MRKLGIFEKDKVSVKNNEKIEFKNSYYEFWCKGKESWQNDGRSLIDDEYYDLIFPFDGSGNVVGVEYYLATRMCRLENGEPTFGLCCVYDTHGYCVVRGAAIAAEKGGDWESPRTVRPVVSINLDTLGLKLQKVSRRYLRANR